MLAPIRIDPIPAFHKEAKTILRDRVFERHKTVFKAWVEDTPESIKDCIEHDRTYWKLPKIIKDEEELAKVVEIFERHGEALKNLFLTCASKSDFPQIVKTHFVDACTAWGIIGKLLPGGQAETCVIAALTNDHKFEGGKKTNQMSRFEFFEAIFRVAQKRFYDSGECKSNPEALQHLLD